MRDDCLHTSRAHDASVIDSYSQLCDAYTPPFEAIFATDGMPGVVWCSLWGSIMTVDERVSKRCGWPHAECLSTKLPSSYACNNSSRFAPPFENLFPVGSDL